jgi:hypothetical protein
MRKVVRKEAEDNGGGLQKNGSLRRRLSVVGRGAPASAVVAEDCQV